MNYKTQITKGEAFKEYSRWLTHGIVDAQDRVDEIVNIVDIVYPNSNYEVVLLVRQAKVQIVDFESAFIGANVIDTITWL